MHQGNGGGPDDQSPSSRRAWIEIHPGGLRKDRTHVALLAEGVDRNFGPIRNERGELGSPSSRRAWIEIMEVLGHFFSTCVALLAEGVARNKEHPKKVDGITTSPSSRRAWIEMKNTEQRA